MVALARLILFEGLPGAGKSTMAQWATLQLQQQGIKARWWYEEAKHHPLYLFQDVQGIPVLVSELYFGCYERFIAATLARWQTLIEDIVSSDEVVALDSCFFNHSICSLLLADVPRGVIADFVLRIAEAVSPTKPRLIYFYQQDIGQALRRVCSMRGKQIEQSYVGRVARSPYGWGRGLSGFTGLVTYWQEYQTLADQLYGRIDCAKLSIENSGGDWPAYRRQVASFLDLCSAEAVSTPTDYLARFVGTYSGYDGDEACEAEVALEQGHLYVCGLPPLWPRNRLLSKSHNVFQAESWPLDVIFEEDDGGVIRSLMVRGEALLSEERHQRFVKDS